MLKGQSPRSNELRIPYRRFNAHKCVAKQRGVSFNLTFDEWFAIWQASGKWEMRGYGSDKYCMSRVGDLGAYEKGNVFIQLHSANVSDAMLGKKKTYVTGFTKRILPTGIGSVVIEKI